MGSNVRCPHEVRIHLPSCISVFIAIQANNRKYPCLVTAVNLLAYVIQQWMGKLVMAQFYLAS